MAVALSWTIHQQQQPADEMNIIYTIFQLVVPRRLSIAAHCGFSHLFVNMDKSKTEAYCLPHSEEQ